MFFGGRIGIIPEMGTSLFARRAACLGAAAVSVSLLAGCQPQPLRKSDPSQGKQVILQAPPATQVSTRSSDGPTHYPLFYGLPTVEGVTQTLIHIHHRIDAAHSPRLIDPRTRQEITDFSKPTPNAIFDSGPDRRFQAISYPLGVIHFGMVNASEATGDPRFAAYTAKWYQFYADHLEQLRGWQGNGNPLHNLFAPGSLDACGSFTAAMINARLHHVGPDLSSLITTGVDYVYSKQFRLPDGTLARKRPIEDSIWADDMYMGGNILTQAYKMTGDAKYIDEAAKQCLQISDHLWIPEVKLQTHGWNSVVPDYHPRYFWARANGWCLVEMAEVLTVLPENHPSRAALVKRFREFAQGIATVQAGDGFWHQLLDRPDSYTETSATAMFTYAIARGVNIGVLDGQTYGPVAMSGWNATNTRVDAEGRVTVTCIGTSYAADYMYYYHRPATDDMHGYGPVLLAGSEMVKLLKNPAWHASFNGGSDFIKLNPAARARR